ncbi:hypothetical protein HOLleu_38574 [Holothuria leucospilota]|uniref:Uncharacterized protein n=2 Tax=Holothuria leucospilota TaxID=206669 RepID=A0A9Q1BDN6_HOLLE|nr:hypothetical protein HOLleu_38574 [Holothuria leucospilota]
MLFWKEVPQEIPVRLDCSDVDSLFSSTGDEALSEVSTVKAPSLSPADTIILPTSPSSSTSSPLSWLHDPLDEVLAPVIAKPDFTINKSQSHQLGGNEQLEATCSGSQPQDRKAALFDVRKILLDDKNGPKLVEKIDGTRSLVKLDKRKLCHILAAHIVSVHGYKPSSCIKAGMAQGIIDAFPFLRDPDGETGYESFYCRGSKNGPAAGTLEDRISYLRRLSYAKEDVGLPKLKRIRDVQQKGKPDTRLAKYRRQWMMETEGQQRTMADILEEFPYLLNPGMIEKDFSFIEPISMQKLYEKWPRLSDQLIRYAKTTLTWSDLDILPDKPIDELTQDEKHNLAIHLLPYLFPGRRKGGRISAKQSSAAFVDFQCESTNLEFYLKNITEKPQPYVLILGGSRIDPQQVFVIIERHALPQTTLMKAIDVCYKAMFVFNLEYQKACIGTWEFLQKIVYEHQGRKDDYSFKQQYWPTEQQFDDESFEMLGEEDMKQIIPKMGLRLKFIRHYRAQESFYCRGSKNGPAAGTLEDRISYLRRLSYAKEDVGLPKLKRIRDVQQKGKPDTRLAKYRRQWMMETEGQQRTMADILEEFPYLLNPGMIEKDFSFIEPISMQKLYEKWPRLSDQLIRYAKTTLTWSDLDILPDKPIDELTQDEKHNLAIHLLPYLFPGRRKGGRISAKQSSAAFVDFQCESTNLEFYLKNITEKPQPYVLILGGSRIDPQQVFVIIERHALPQTTLMKAIDVCYKAMFVFNLEYQKACIGTWEFLQKIVYEHQGNVKCNQIREFRTFCACAIDKDNVTKS